MLNIKVDMGLSNISNVEFIGMKFAEQMIRSWGQSGLAMHWLMNEYFCYCYKNEIDSLMRKDQVKENLRKRFEGSSIKVLEKFLRLFSVRKLLI